MIQIRVLITFIFVLEIVGFQNPILAQTDQNTKLIIVIDPGHGGKDSGAVGVYAIQEKDVVLKIAKQIVELNNTVFKNCHEIFLTRYKDTLISLGDRTKMAKTLKADIFISLHCNHSDKPNARGLEVYVSKKQSEYSKESILLAYELQKELKESLGFESRGVKFANFQVLRETSDYFPSVLVELGFLSNWDENRFISKLENIVSYALIILKNLTREAIK